MDPVSLSSNWSRVLWPGDKAASRATSPSSNAAHEGLVGVPSPIDALKWLTARELRGLLRPRVVAAMKGNRLPGSGCGTEGAEWRASRPTYASNATCELLRLLPVLLQPPPWCRQCLEPAL